LTIICTPSAQPGRTVLSWKVDGRLLRSTELSNTLPSVVQPV